MEKKTRFCLCGGFLCFFVLVVALFAAGEEIELPASLDPKVAEQAWQEGIFSVRDSAEVLIKENERLNEENNSLLTQFLELQERFEEAKQENLRLAQEPERLKGSVEKETVRLRSLEKKAKELEQKI